MQSHKEQKNKTRHEHRIKCCKPDMLHVIQAVTFLITFLSPQGLDSAATNCSLNWFGENCMYECKCCKCAGVTCSKFGNCPRDKCLQNYFGPGCQFFDSVSSSYTSSTESFIYDFDRDTCNPNASATSVEVELTEKYMFMWFRIEVKDTNNILNFTVEINNDTKCTNERKFPGNYFVDVTCDSNTSLQALRITGPIAPDVCSIYVSAGRNVALKQNATQFSTLTGLDRFAASNAVDGKVFGDVLNPSCTLSEAHSDPWWTLTYNRPQILFAIYITNYHKRKDLLQGFTLQAFDNNGDTVIHFVDTSSEFLSQYVIPGGIIPVKVLNITITSDLTLKVERVLAMCEVKTFGETVCPDGTYGLWCGENCQCNGTEICNSVIGICAPGCDSGFYGYNCLSSCNYTCLDGLCTNREGKCLSCIDGFVGEFCEHAGNTTAAINHTAPLLPDNLTETSTEEKSTLSDFGTGAAIGLVSSGMSMGIYGCLYVCHKPDIELPDIEACSPLELIKKHTQSEPSLNST